MALQAADGGALYIPFSFTHVLFEEGDTFGHALALISLTPVFVMVAYATLIVSRRDLPTIALAAGQLANEALNHLLKHQFKTPRPAHPAAGTGGDGQLAHAPRYGMPSDHAQFVAFAATYLSYWALRKWAVGAAWKQAFIGALWALAAAVAYSRVYLVYHDWSQVGAGLGVGYVTGAAWYCFTEHVLRKRVFPAVAASALARAAYIRDTSGAGNLLAAEYAAAAAPANPGRKQA